MGFMSDKEVVLEENNPHRGCRVVHCAPYSTVTLLARLRGLSTSHPRATAIEYAKSCSGMTARMGTSGSRVRGMKMTSSAREATSSSPSCATAMIRPAAGAHLVDVPQHLVADLRLRREHHGGNRRTRSTQWGRASSPRPGPPPREYRRFPSASAPPPAPWDTRTACRCTGSPRSPRTACDLFDAVLLRNQLLACSGSLSRASRKSRPARRDSPLMRPRCTARRLRTTSWLVKAFVEATPISGPAWM